MSSSPVFQAMFENDMQEKKNSEVRIEDIPSDAVKLMLDYIYGGVLPTNTILSQSQSQPPQSSSSSHLYLHQTLNHHYQIIIIII